MEDTSENKKNLLGKIPSEHICVGLLAHVDAGKTTLAESLLFLSGSLRKQGRVDHRDAFLDTEAMERARGITIFSKQARLTSGSRKLTLLDTPGHEDFGAEMERTLAVLDYAVLIISGPDGVRAHDETLWHLLEHYNIPVFLFINKMDQPGCDREALLKVLETKLRGHFVDFSDADTAHIDFSDAGVAHIDFFESVAMGDEALLEKYLETGSLETPDIARAISERKIFPCYFGAALKNAGVQALLTGLEQYTICPVYPEEFGARVYKISRDARGVRLTHMKITGGCLKVKQPLLTGGDAPEKADQLRQYSGAGFTPVSEAKAGDICAVTGPVHTYAGQGLGIEADAPGTILKPVLTYEIRLPDGCNVHEMLLKLKALEEELPELNIVWNEQSREIHAQVMGDIQIEILKSMIRERFGVDVEFDSGSIVYRETIADTVEGVGHFEPLRHYAEVHLLMEPLPPGSGIVIESACSEDVLDRNWQHLILYNLAQKKHPGVLTGSQITDIKITLMTGRAHIKHTEGGDFRQAALRAVRQGLKCAKSVLLEPVYRFILDVPGENVGRALSDIQKMSGSFEPPETLGEITRIRGKAPVACMRDYASEVTVYTRGRGRLFCEVSGYEPCHNADEVIARTGYDSEADVDNPAGSVFCAHGAGFNVPWDKVYEYMHLPSCIKKNTQGSPKSTVPSPERVLQSRMIDDDELEAIFVRTYGPIKRERHPFGRALGGSAAKTRSKTEKDRSQNTGGRSTKITDGEDKYKKTIKPEAREYLLVDGYNIIFSWDELNELSRDNMDSARMKLADILCDYQGYCRSTVILVFDAYRVEGHPGEILQYKNIYIVYTKEAETADQYIEKTVHDIGRRHHVTVATSDGTEQVIILGQGAHRLSARGLLEAIIQARRQLREEYLKKHSGSGHYLMENVSGDMARMLEDVRLGYRSLDPADNEKQQQKDGEK